MWRRQRRELDRQLDAVAATHAQLAHLVCDMREAIGHVEDASMEIHEQAGDGGRSEGGSASAGPTGRTGEPES